LEFARNNVLNTVHSSLNIERMNSNNATISDVIGTVVSIGDIVPVNGYGCSKIRRTVVIEDTQIYARLFKENVGMIRDIELETYCVVYATIHSI
nr:hypothetical protein [Tanacetum cinerariifolium]